jgi:predicted DNA-binding transcriptional regulator AlpA
MQSHKTKPSRPPSDSAVTLPATYVVGDISAKLRISDRQVWRMNDSGRMPPPIRIGRLVRWPIATIDAWIADGCPPVRKGVR